MCGRFTLTAKPEELARHFELEASPELSPRFNIAPGQPVASVRLDGGRVLELRDWGLVPPWAEDPRIGARCINARAETASTKAAFRRAFRERRCLIPADGFYEWGKGSGLPYHVALPERAPFGLAGLFEEWRGADGRAIASCTILTTRANSRLAEIHERMPVILDPQDYARWLDPELREPEAVSELLGARLCDELSPQRVGRRVNDVRIDEPGLLEPVQGGPEPAQLGLDL